MWFPKLKALKTKQEMLDVFRGYNRNTRIKEGEFRDMQNLTGDHYPVLAVRKQRHCIDYSGYEGDITGIIETPRGTAHIQGGDLYILGIKEVEPELDDKPKQLVMLGEQLIIFPDKKYVNLETSNDYGSMGHVVEVLQGEVTFELCDVEGTVYPTPTLGDTAPSAPGNGALWIDSSMGEKVLKRYSKSLDTWMNIDKTYVKISGLNQGTDGQSFSQYDGIVISGCAGDAEGLNGSAVLQTKDNASSIVVEGFLEKKVTQDCAHSGTIRVERPIPDMDYVVEAGNRLWGCHYGYDGKNFVNKIYASKLGDFRNWNCYMGLASDSWDCDVGSQGPFTGAANVGGCPVFYKEDMRHKVWISDSGAHQVTSTPCQGVKLDCGASVAIMDGAAIYKSYRGFCIDDGSGPEEIGACFAGADYSNAVGCVCGHKYYVSMKDEDGRGHLFVYDGDRKLWHREDDFLAVAMAGLGRNIVAVRKDSGNQLVSMCLDNSSLPKAEGAVSWYAETGEIGLDDPGRKYISRLTLRLRMEAGAELTVYVQYDTEPEWVALGSIRGTGLQSFSLPLRLRRCDHFRLRLEGVGDVKLYSITKTIQEGSIGP